MSTHNLARTVVEGGSSGTWTERYHTRQERQAHRVFLARVKSEDDHAEFFEPGPRRRDWDKGFTDKLGPVNRYLQANAGHPWAKVFSELCQRFDRRTLKGWHLIDGHIKGDLERRHEWSLLRLRVYGAWVDRHGILRYTQRKRWGR